MSRQEEKKSTWTNHEVVEALARRIYPSAFERTWGMGDDAVDRRIARAEARSILTAITPQLSRIEQERDTLLAAIEGEIDTLDTLCAFCVASGEDEAAEWLAQASDRLGAILSARRVADEVRNG